MEVNCEGCAGCCIDWRPLADRPGHEHRGHRRPVDDVHNLVPLTGDEVRAFVREGLGDALTPRPFVADDGPTVEVGGHDLAAIGGRPVFLVGLRKPAKPVGPFDTDPAWLPTCVFLDPETLQCRIHGEDLYPEACATYPGENLLLGAETECERVERAFGGERLLDDEPPEGATPLFDPTALGSRVFAHPDPGTLAGAVERIAAGTPTTEDRAWFVAAAAAAAPGSTEVDRGTYERVRDAVREADSWVGRAVAAWEALADGPADPELAREVEGDAPATPGWD